MMEETPKTMAQVLPAVIKKYIGEARCIIPANIQEYDKNTRKATVLPLIGYRASNGQLVDIKPITDVPCCYLGGTSLSIDIEYQKGDTVLLSFSDYGIGNWKGSDGTTQVAPDNYSSHDLQDAIVLMGLAPENKDFATNKLSVDKDGNIELNNASGYIKLNKSGQVDINGNLTIDA